jgi:chemotaxis signal transduction protein
VINLRGKMIPVMDLRVKFGMESIRILADRLEHGIAVPEIDGPGLCH